MITEPDTPAVAKVPIVYHNDYVTPLPDGHRFPMPKFKLLYDLLLEESVIHSTQVHRPEIASHVLLEKAHSSEYVTAFCDGTLSEKAVRKIGLPWSEALVTRTRTAVGGTYLTAKLALDRGLACNLAGGTHHAFSDHGSGFRIFNDMAVVSQALLDENAVRQILIIDLDVHQGDGTAAIFGDEARVFTFSMHCEKNFPFIKQKSDSDVSLPVGTPDAAYLGTLKNHLNKLLDEVRPDLVFYDAGVDPHRNDALGKLSLTDAGLFERDKFVIQSCVDRKIPIATVIGGGYDKNRRELAYRHSFVVRAALAMQ